MKLQDRVAVITGADGHRPGDGPAFRPRRARASSLPTVTREAAQATAAAITGAGGTAHPFTVDVSQPEQVAAMITEALTIYGRIDILCNNAGIGSTTDVVACEPDEWDRVMTVNVKSVYLGCNMRSRPCWPRAAE